MLTVSVQGDVRTVCVCMCAASAGVRACVRDAAVRLLRGWALRALESFKIYVICRGICYFESESI